jgi:hypothetical protein
MSVDVTNTYTLPDMPTLALTNPAAFWGRYTFALTRELIPMPVSNGAKVEQTCIPIIFYSRVDEFPIIFQDRSDELPIVFYEYVKRERQIIAPPHTLPNLPTLTKDATT